MYRYWKQIKSLSISSLLALPLVACAGSPAIVKTGDSVEMSFTCRLSGGELAASTRPDSSLTGEAKAPFYLPRTGSDMVTVMAGPKSPDAQQDRLPFEMEIVQRLASIIPGLKEGEQVQRVLEAERYPVSEPDQRLVKMAKVRIRPKEMRLTREEYTARTRKTPEVGQPFVQDKMVPGKVSEVTEKEVAIRFTPAPAQDLTTPFGPVTVRETAGHYELEIAAEKGRLIRTGPMAGRITAVDQEFITIDYGHPFAGEQLDCELQVVKVVPREAKDVSAPVPASSQRAKLQEAL